MKLRTEGVNLATLPSLEERNGLPLDIVYVCHRYSLALGCRQVIIEQVLEDLMREERKELEKMKMHCENVPFKYLSSVQLQHSQLVSHS